MVTLQQACELLLTGEVVAVPTETVYGLAANALNPIAVAKIFALKQRPTFHPLIVHESSMDRAARWVVEFPRPAQILADAFWPGPLTMVLPKRSEIADLVTGGMPSVGIRVPKHELTLELIRLAGVPLAAPSANLFGKISPTTALHVTDSLEVPVLDGGPCGIGLESTILGWTGRGFKLLRLGGLSVEAIEEKIGSIDQSPSEKSIAPGMLKAHYQPSTPLRFRQPGQTPNRSGVGLLTLNANEKGFERIFSLSAKGDLQEAAAHLFEGLRFLDGAGLTEIWVDRVPEVGIGRAINDRLIRASHINKQ